MYSFISSSVCCTNTYFEKCTVGAEQADNKMMIADENVCYEKDYAVRVAVRIRPLNSREIIDMCRECASVVPNEPQIVLGLDKAFTFDFVYDITSTQCEIYEGCVFNLVEGALHGLNATVLAYGQTGSGKTYTMGSGFDCEFCDHQLGIIPRAVHHIFSRIKENQSQFNIAVQFIELYNEEIVDLLDPCNKKNTFKILENEYGQISVSGATIKAVQSPQDALRCLQQGALTRTTASTQMNDQSSRSHAIYSILIRRQRVIASDNEFVNDDIETLTSKFHFVDLAGSERLKRTGATGERAREGISINCGLLALGNCISALGDKSKKTMHIPYRDSKLTRLLQDSLGGNSQTIMIACISPSDRDFMETLNTLKYANRAKNIKNKVQVNQDQNSRTISQLRKEVASLQLEILEIKQGKRLIDADGNVNISDTFCENEMLLRDNKRLQQRLKSMQETINVLTEKNTQLLLEKELSKWSAVGDTDESIKNMIAEYLLAIEQLQAKLIESEEMYQQFKTLRGSITFSGNKVISSEDTAIVLQLAKENVKKEREYVMAKSDCRNESRNGDDCESESSNDEYVRANDLHADLNDINCDIEIKTKLIEQLELSHKRMQLMKQNYEDKLMLLSSKILNTKKERDEVLANIGSAENYKDDKISKIRDEYERKIVIMRTEMKKLQYAQREHVRQQQEIISQETKLRNLRVQLQELKTIKARLMKTIAEQNNRHKLEGNLKRREIAKLQKEHRKQENSLRTLKAKMEAKDQILKRKTEEVTSLRRSQRSIKSSVQYKKVDEVFFNANTALQIWNKFSKALDRVAHNRHILLQFEQELERLINERNSLIHTLTNLKNIDSSQYCERDVEEDSIQSNLNYVQDNIQNVQHTIMEFEDTKDLEGNSDSNLHTIINNIKHIEEAKFILQRMSAFVIKLTCNFINTESRLSDHIILFQEYQQENLIQQQLLQHFLAQNSSEKITDLFESLTVSVSKLSNNNLNGSRRSLKSNETYDISPLDGISYTSDNTSSTVNEMSTKVLRRAAVQHSIFFDDQKL